MTTATLSPDKARALAETIRDPVAFSRGILAHDPWQVQQRMLRAIDRPQARVAVKGCHSSGKTFIAADAVLHHITKYPDGIAITTAPSKNQVEKTMWPAIRAAAAQSRIAYPKPLQTELRIDAHRYATGFATDRGVRFQGFHGRVLIVVDEAPGMEADINDAIEGIAAGGDVRILQLGNPTIPSGAFYEAFTAQRGLWTCITISAFDTPNLAGLTLESLLALPADDLDRNVRPELTTRRWVRDRYAAWGPGDYRWQSRVLGEFPTQAEDALIALAWLERARYRTPEDTGGTRVTAGLDVAGPGDDETVLYLRTGESILGWQAWPDADPRGAVLAALQPYRERIDCVNVDSAGIGYYLARHIEDAGYPVAYVNVGEAPEDREQHANLKAELYWGLRMRFEAGDVAGLTDETAIAQLAGIRYSHNARGQVVIESKDDARKRGVKSPDRAEALMLAFRPATTWLIA